MSASTNHFTFYCYSFLNSLIHVQHTGFPTGPFHRTPANTPGRGAATNFAPHFNPGTPAGGASYFNQNVFPPGTPCGGAPPNFVPNNFYHTPGTPGGYASFNNQGYPDHGIPGGFSTVGSHAGSFVSSDAPSWGQQQQLNHRQRSLFIEKENHVNAPAPSIPSHVSSIGEVSSIGGFSNLSINGHKSNSAAKKDEKMVDVQEQVILPDFFQEFILQPSTSNQHIEKARNDVVYAIKTNSELLINLRGSKTLKRSKNLVEGQQSIYDEEARVFQGHIVDVERKKKDSEATHEKDMADIADEEAEAIRVVQARFAEKRAHKKNELARKMRDLDAEGEEWEQKKEQSKAEMVENLGLAKAYLTAFETGVEIVESLAQLESNAKNQEFLDRLNNLSIRRLGEFQHFHLANAVDALKPWAWVDEDL